MSPPGPGRGCQARVWSGQRGRGAAPSHGPERDEIKCPVSRRGNKNGGPLSVPTRQGLSLSRLIGVTVSLNESAR